MILSRECCTGHTVKNIRNSICYFIDIPFEARLQFIVEAYGKFPVAELIAATLRIQKRLGGLETKTAINFFIILIFTGQIILTSQTYL